MSSTTDPQQGGNGEELSDAELTREFHKHLDAAAVAFANGDHERAREALHGVKSYNARMAERRGWSP